MERIGRKEREFKAHRKEILEAAERLFARKGFFPTTMSEIAEEAEFGTGTLYKFFKSKEDLYFTLINEKVEEINHLVRAELRQKGSVIERIKKILELQFQFTEKNRDFFRIYISERSRFEWNVKEDLGKGVHNKMVSYIRLLAQVMKEGIRKGELKSISPFDLAHALVGIVNSFIFEWIISPKPYSLISKVDTVLEIFLNGTQRIERRK